MKLSSVVQLSERSVSKPLNLSELDTKQAIDLLNTHARDALRLLEANAPLYRGDLSLNNRIKDHQFGLVDPSKTARISNNTSNHYTLIFDNHPDRQDFPKRSRSLVCTTSIRKALFYSPERFINVVVPYDNVKIGVVNKDDIWDTKINMFGVKADIERYNDLFKSIGITDKSFSSFTEFDQLLKAKDPIAIRKFVKLFHSRKNSDQFLEQLFASYSARATGHTIETTATLPIGSNTEVWFSGPAIVMTIDMWEGIRQAL
jgi:hypothetical protein